MGAQAILADDVATFHRRLELLTNIPNGLLNSNISLARAHQRLLHFDAYELIMKQWISYLKDNDKKQALICLHKCRLDEQKAWKHMHLLTKSKAKLTDGLETGWLYLAAYKGRNDKVKSLLKLKRMSTKPFFKAVTGNQTEM